MSKIIFKHSGNGASALKVAGDFTDWAIVPMGYQDDSKQWEYNLDTEKLKSFAIGDNEFKIHFKFIDEDGNWFTDDNFAKEIDDRGNENNVLYLDKRELLPSNEESDKTTEAKGNPEQLQREKGYANTNTPATASVGKDENGNDGRKEFSEDEGPESPNPTPKVPAREHFTISEEEEPPVVINDSDLEGYSTAGCEGEATVDTHRPGTADTTISTRGTPSTYNGFLQRIVHFFKNMFKNWFGMGKKRKMNSSESS